MPLMYATRCTVCNCQTNTLMRLQAGLTLESLKAPDGNRAVVVDNTPGKITFFVEKGQHRGYYHHDKYTGHNEIVAA